VQDEQNINISTISIKNSAVVDLVVNADSFDARDFTNHFVVIKN
jgi:hypothetical protein